MTSAFGRREMLRSTSPPKRWARLLLRKCGWYVLAVVASPDGLGLEEPRIFVEVKRRKEVMGAPAVRSFMGGRRPGDRCLYVSTGGFTREAHYEADRSQVPLTLVDLPQLRELLVEYYEELDEETKALVPLTRVYWPRG